MGAAWIRHVQQNIFVYQVELCRQVVRNFILTSADAPNISDDAMKRAINNIANKIARRLNALESYPIGGFVANNDDLVGFDDPDDTVEDQIPDDVDDDIDVHLCH